ncbi:phosphotransferase [Dactylosporangium aurantiacum]|uniref:Phosphotransferase n=1 Tax=Dactylosporangium aurantiacum TaxID=35754 RepID=A0A9Q9IC12_9ACTN|nr:phosphotransferase [Dactylosporangium aurantiacum]MDG6102447.1 phosphotransferase [Dactylosporangium aurantiacum]UWZ53267.1 phosphotransferase [Dactylosporangium aurantiacum]
MAPESAQVHTTLRRSWQCSPGPCIPLGATAWQVQIDDGQFDTSPGDPGRFVAKWAPATARRGFEAGLCAAEHVEASGLCAGRPVRAADGALTTQAGDGVLALLRLVPGRPLHADDPLDQHWWGGALGAAHRCLRRFVHPDLAKFQAAPVPVAAPHLAMEPWLGPAVSETAAAVRRIMVTDQLTYGVRHGAPAAGRFRLDTGTGRVGLIGWSAAGTGPLLYDLAHAVLCAGGTGTDTLVEAYVRAGPVPADECRAVLPAMLALCAAARAAAVAARIHAGGGTPRDHAELTRLATLLV